MLPPNKSPVQGRSSNRLLRSHFEFQAHVTVVVFYLEESEIVLVQEMMDEIKTAVEEFLSQPVSFKGLGNFNKKVIFVQEYFLICVV